MKLIAVVLAGFVVIQGTQAPPAQVQAADASSQPFLTGITDAASFTRAAETHFAHAQTLFDRLTAAAGPRTVDNTLRLYDDILIEIGLAQGGASAVRRLHGDQEFRRAAEQILSKGAAFETKLSLDRGVYDALGAIDLSRADAEARYYVTRELRAFRLAGVDKDAATRARLQELSAQHAAIRQEFTRNIQEGRSTFKVTVAALDGLPPDFVERHRPDASGLVTLTTEDADARPVLTYAKSDDLRKQMFLTLNTVAYPANSSVLTRMLAMRAEFAQLVGRANWAEYDMAPRMAGSAAAAGAFIDRIVAASEAKARREYDALLKRKQRDVPGATVVNAWENMYYSELERRAGYDFDSQKIRPYLAFDRVKAGLLDLNGRLFDITYRRSENTPVWHPSVEAYELLRDGRVIGRFYLDLHPRPGKEGTGASTTVIRRGVAGRQIPEVALIAALPGGQPNDPGLLTHPEMTTFFHEFGHVINNLFGGHRAWYGTSGTVTERDVSETSSQMFEEWAWDAKTLALFAKHYQTGEVLPGALVEQMRRANEFGQALNVRSQMVAAKLSLSLHDRDPKTVDPQAMWKDVQGRWLPFPFVDAAHFETRFGQLANANYSSSYYTYMWSLVIAKDLFSRFDAKDLLAPTVARRYRDTILAPGSSKPAAALYQDFLGRPFNATAWERWLNLSNP